MVKKPTRPADEKDAGTGAPAKPYVVLARKYRPQTFDDLIGQEAMVKTLRNAFATGRIAQGYMLTGVRGVGKTTTARILARALNYETDKVSAPAIDMPALGRHCADIIESRHPDVIEMDAASNTGVDNVREIIESARYKPILARTKVFIIDEVHMLSKAAFNALLKTLEEPPEHVKFIFATTEIRKVPVTVLSRCQRFDLRRVDVPVLASHFKRIAANEDAEADDDALTMIARAAEGSVRDGLSILDQAIAMGSGRVTAENVRAMLGLADRGRILDLLEALFAGDAAESLKSLAALHRDGAEPAQVLSDLAEAVHITARIKTVGPGTGGEGLPADETRRAAGLAARLSVPLLSRAWQMLVKGIEETARAPDPVAAAEMVLIRIAYAADLPPPGDVIKALGGDPSRTSAAGAADRTGSSGGERPILNELDVPAPRADLTDQAVAGAGARADTGRGAPSRPAQQSGAPIASVPAGRDGEPPADDEIMGEFAPVDALPEGLEGDVFEDDDAAPNAVEVQSGLAQPRSFTEVVALVGARRDAKLKVHLEEHVSLVKFDAAAGSIDLFLLPGAPSEIANDLREKLNKWTGRRWVIVLSKTKGEPPIGEVRREREAAELAELKRHPAVAAIFEAFPDAKVAELRVIPGAREDETGT